MNEITPEMFNLALMYLNSTNAPVKKIKVTSEFATYLENVCHPIYYDNIRDGVRGTFTGIPVVIDDEIENEFYELVY